MLCQMTRQHLLRQPFWGIVFGGLLLSACGQSPAPANNVSTNNPNQVSEQLAACLPQPASSNTYLVKPANSVTDFTMNIRTIMPPGNDGHFTALPVGCPGGVGCNLPGNDPDSYGEHIDDQREMYWNHEFKEGGFTDISGLTPDHDLTLSNGDTVKIYKADFGVPVVHGDSAYAVWYGVGYVMGEDRLFLMDAALRQGTGRFAEITGTGSVADDVQRRTLRYSEAEYQQFYQQLSPLAKETLDGFVAGANAWIDRVNTGQAPVPMEYVGLTFTPQAIKATDVLALGVYMTRFVAAAGGDEMVNVKFLQELTASVGKETARKIFKDVLWVDDKLATVTIPDQTFTNISTPEGLRDAALEQAMDFAETLPLSLASGPGTGDFPEPPPVQVKLPKDFEWPYPPAMLAEIVDRYHNRDKTDHISASYQVTANDAATAGDSTLILSAPQLGYSYPTLFYEIEVHGGGFHARGAGVPGLPVVGIGYGSRVAWALTTGESKTIDSFIVELTGQETYLHDGEEKQMDCRDEVINYRASAQGVPVGPAINSQDIRVCRTVHGPVVARSDDGKYARAVQYGMWMREIETVEGVLRWSQAQNWSEFHAAMQQVTWNENTMYADADGNIAYYHPGLHPWRHPAVDQRLPAKGDGSQDHCDTLSFANTPHRVNPPRGFMHNWNNKPAIGWGDGVSGDASQEPAAKDGRNRNWELLLSSEVNGEVDGHGDDSAGVSYADMFDFDKRIGRIDPKAAALRDVINRCLGDANPCGLSSKQSAMLAELQTWDGQHYNDAIDPLAAEDSEAAKDTAAATIFSAIVDGMVAELTEGLLPAEIVARHERRGNHPYDAGTFHKLLVRIFKPEDSSIALHYDWLEGASEQQFLAAAFSRAEAALVAEFGAEAAVTGYRRMHARSDVCSLAAPLVGPCITMPHQDRGSWIHVIEFSPN